MPVSPEIPFKDLKLLTESGPSKSKLSELSKY